MRSIGRTMLKAAWLAGALVGLLAVLALPGRWQGPALAHDTTTTSVKGVQLIDTDALCDAHNLDADDDTAEDDEGTCADRDSDADAFPFLPNFASDGDGDLDTILVKRDQVFRVVAHVFDGAANVACGDGTVVTFAVSPGQALITAFSADANDNCVLDNSGELTDIPGGTDTVDAHAVGDTKSGGPCDGSSDTCIDNGEHGGNGDADGIAMVDVICTADKKTITITASYDFGGPNIRSDSMTVRCAGDQDEVEIVPIDWEAYPGQVLAPHKPYIAQVPAGFAAGGDPDVALAIFVRDTNGDPVPKQPVDCEITAGEARADLQSNGTLDNGGVDPGGNFVNNDGDTHNTFSALFPPGLKVISLESQAGGGKGEVTVECWVDENKNDDRDSGEAFDTITIRIAGPPDTVAFDTAPAKVTAPDDLELTAQVLDNTGEAVADGTVCKWGIIGELFPASFSVTDVATENGKVGATLFIGSPTPLSGNFLNVSVGCQDGDSGQIFDFLTFEVNEPGAPPPGEPGDVNKDGTINVFDALAILLDIVGQTDLEFPENADVNEDGSTNIFDALEILGTVAGL